MVTVLILGAVALTLYAFFAALVVANRDSEQLPEAPVEMLPISRRIPERFSSLHANNDRDARRREVRVQWHLDRALKVTFLTTTHHALTHTQEGFVEVVPYIPISTPIEQSFALLNGQAHSQYLFHPLSEAEELESVAQKFLNKVSEFERREGVAPTFCPDCDESLRQDQSAHHLYCRFKHGRLVTPEGIYAYKQVLGFDNAQLLALSESSESAFFDCPACASSMRTIVLEKCEVELCRGCGCLWLEEGEIEIGL